MAKIISGIQQIGIGVENVYEAWDWYRKILGFDVEIFDEAAEANLMLPYTNNKPQRRHAILTMNIKGGGGLEIWEYKSRKPEAPKYDIQLGDLGIFIMKIKTDKIQDAYNNLLNNKANILSNISKSPEGVSHFYIKDPYNNIIEIEESDQWNLKLDKLFGGNSGSVIGVSDMDKSIAFYAKILGYDKVIYDKTGVFDDMIALPGGKKSLRRVLLKHTKPVEGAFSPLLGPSSVELICDTQNSRPKIYQDRLWGDLGYIHLCYDISGMDELREECKAFGYPFTVDSSNSFDMGEAAGHFSYIEDPDATLIEFVETHKIPVMKKIGWYLNLTKRDPKKPLPKWFFKVMNMMRKS